MTEWKFTLEVSDEEDEGCEELARLIESALLDRLPGTVTFELTEEEED